MQRMALLLVIVSLAGFACASRSVTTKVVDYYDLDIKLRGSKSWFGGYESLGYAQPVEISSNRLANILGGIEVDVRKTKTSPVRERRSALSAKMLLNVSKALPEAFAEASANQQIIVMAQRKQMQKGVFNRKYLTSFTTYVKGEDLYVFFSRVEWKLDETTKTTRIPQPWPGEVVMPFETVETATYTKVGEQGVRVKWQSSEFGFMPSASPAPTGATTTTGEAAASDAQTGEATSGAASAISEPTAGETAASSDATTASDAAASDDTTTASDTTAASEAAAATSGTAADSGGDAPRADPLQGLSARDLRDLANLEESYRAGRMDTEQYQRERARILARGD